MNDIITVSIICDVYNHAPYLRQCLDGFIMQKTSFAYEVLIHDDASIDDSANIIREYEEKYPNIIKPVYQNVNQYSQGISIWQNYQFSRIRGKYIALCEGDDYWIDTLKLQKQVDFLEKNDEYGLVYTFSKIFVQNKQKFSFHDLNLAKCSLSDLIVANPISTLTTMFRVKLLNEYQDFYRQAKFANKKWLMADYPMWIFFASKMKIYCLSEYTSVYRELSSSASHSGDIQKNFRFVECIRDISLFYSNLLHLESLNDSIQTTFLLNLYSVSMKHNEWEYFSSEIRKANSQSLGLKLRLLKIISLAPAIYKFIPIWRRGLIFLGIKSDTVNVDWATITVDEVR